MAYLFSGRFCGYICTECQEPLANVKIRLYRPSATNNDNLAATHAATDLKQSFAILTDENVKEKSPALLAEATTDENGSYAIRLGEKQEYDGGPLQVDIYVERVPGQKDDANGSPLQFTVATITPEWNERGNDVTWNWEYCLPHRFWCAIRSRFDAWVICGRLTTCKGNIPLAKATVTAYDADWLQDDALGSAITDGNGRFRIDYSTADFRKTPLSPWINFELIGGPDIYFKAELDGSPIIDENSGDARVPGRENIGHCFCVHLCTDEVQPGLTCNLAEPTGCVHGDANIMPGHVLEPVIGTALGAGFDRYEIDILWNGTGVVNDAVIYADSSGNPDASLSSGNHQVTNGTLGFIDLHKAAQGAGANILTSTDFEIRLHVFGANGDIETCIKTFSITASRTYIKTIGGAVAPDFTNPNEPLRVSDNAASDLATVGGNISVRGAAVAYGCDDEKIAEYNLWAKEDPAFSLPQPANGSSFDPTGWAAVASVVYANDDQRTYNTLDGMPNPDYLTNTGWFTRQLCSYIDGLPPICWGVPDLHEFKWNSPASGKYTFLLQLVDTAGNTYYDIQRAWIDNEVIRGKIDSLRYHGESTDLPPCSDIHVNNGSDAARVLDIRGFATDPLIVSGDTTTPTSDNFNRYTVWFRKQGAPSDIRIVTSNNPVPDRATWSGGSGDPPVDVLAEWDLSWIDAGTPAPNDADGNPIPANQRLARGESCTYDVILWAWDKTIVNEGTVHHTGKLTFPVKIVNDLP